jgi:WD40 repeat protein
MRILEGHRGAVRALAYAPDDPSLLASGGDDKTVRLWEPITGHERAVLSGHRDGVLALAFAPDGGRLTSSGREGAVMVWNVDLANPVALLHLPTGPILSVAFHPDGRSILAVQRTQRYPGIPAPLLVWGPEQPPECDSIERPVAGRRVTTAPGGWAVGLADEERQVEVWDAALRQRLASARFATSIRGLAFAPGPRRRLAVAHGKLVEVWDLEAERRTLCKGHRAEVHSVAFSPDGHRLLTGSSDCTVRLWDADSGRQLRAVDWKRGHVYAVAIAPDGMTAAAGAKAGIVVWDIDEG